MKFSNLGNIGSSNQCIKNGHIPSSAERELNGIRDIQRGKSFLEARTAVQKHIEKMLNHNNHNSQHHNGHHNQGPSSQNGQNGDGQMSNGNESRSQLLEVKHPMHGVSHAIPGELDDIEKPLPVHYGVDAAIKSGSVALKAGNLSRNRGHFVSSESLTTIVKEPSLARGQSQESVVQVRVTSPVNERHFTPQNRKIIVPLSSSGNYFALYLVCPFTKDFQLA